MPNRIAKFRSALLASLLAGTALTVASHTPAGAADNCLRAPRDETPPGHHWYYRIDHPTQRQCWYLGEEKDKRARTAPLDLQPSTDADPPKARPAQRSVADARAELQWPAPRIEQQTSIAGPQPAVAAVPNMAESGNNQQTATADADGRTSVVASRWPEASDTPPSANPVPAAPANSISTASASSVPVTVAAAAVAPSNATVPLPPTAPVVILAAADVPAGKPTESVPMLLTIAVGALSVAGVMASAIFRIGSKRRRSRRRQIWDDRRAPPWDSADAKRPSPPAPAYRHPRELHDKANPRRRPRPADGPPNDRVADFYGEISRRART